MTKANKIFCKIIGGSAFIAVLLSLSAAFVIMPGPVAAAASPKPEPPRVESAPDSSVEPPFITDEQMAVKDAATTQCLMERNIPLMGFGLKVVCVKKDAISWVR